MAKDPAFLFYSQDWIVGCQTLSFEERGKYITILSQMHQQGRLTEETIRLLVGSVSVSVKSKFQVDEKGFWYNERLELEVEKRRNFTESRKRNGSKGGRPGKNKNRKKPIKTDRLATNNHMEDEIEDANEDQNKRGGNLKIEVVLPFQTDRFREVWEEWKQYRRDEVKKPFKTIKAEQRNLMGLNRDSGHNEETAIKMIERSMESGWTGLFPLDMERAKTKNLKEKDEFDQYAADVLHRVANMGAKSN